LALQLSQVPIQGPGELGTTQSSWAGDRLTLPTDGSASGRKPEKILQIVSKRRRIARRPGQHMSAPHSDPSSKIGSFYEVIVGFTVYKPRHPIYRRYECPKCHVPAVWGRLSHSREIAPICTVCNCVAPVQEYVASKPKPTPDAIRDRQYRKFAKGRC